ncbi:MAG TPA: hypothetical protein VFT22_33530 [Kofleriaceae bacterium]|nr:hypothetical protein [Kofleriaceae bacterium]
MRWLAGILLVLEAATAWAGGRVVRIERTGGSDVAPRLCELRGDAGTCVGDEPRPGQIVTVLDEHHVVAEVQILEETSAAAGCPNLWTVKTRTVRGSIADSDGIGMIDPGINPARAHTLDRGHLPASPGGVPGEEVWRAVDRDGDGTADVVLTHYNCDAAGKWVSGGGAYCIDVWARMRTRMVRTTQLNFAQCSH